MPYYGLIYASVTKAMANDGFQRSTRHPALALDPETLAALEISHLHGAAKELLNSLDARTRRILEGRFGIADGQPKTLQEIGDLEKITRERVRQLERSAVRSLRSLGQDLGPPGSKTSPLTLAGTVRAALLAALESLGRVATEETLVATFGLSKDKERAVLRFLLTSLPGVSEAKETQRTTRHWTLSPAFAGDPGRKPGEKGEAGVPHSLGEGRQASAGVAGHQVPRVSARGAPNGTQTGGGSEKEPPSLEQVLEAVEGVLGRARNVLPDARFLAEVRAALGTPVTDQALRSLLAAAKRVSHTAFGDWGLSAWREVTPKGVGDKAYIVLKRTGKPLHFVAITEAVNAVGFDGRRAHPQTVHNELIRGGRFVLVGRGLYGLTEWGYEAGTVAEVAQRILVRAGRPLPKRDLIHAVLKERLVKRNTVVLALQNRHLFRPLGDGTYALAAQGGETPRPNDQRGEVGERGPRLEPASPAPPRPS